MRFFPHQTFNSSRVCTNALLQIHSSDFKKFMLCYDDLANMKTHHWGFFTIFISCFRNKKGKAIHDGFSYSKNMANFEPLFHLVITIQHHTFISEEWYGTTYTVHTKFLKILFSTLLYFEKIKFFQRLEMNFLSSSCKKRRKKISLLYIPTLIL